MRSRFRAISFRFDLVIGAPRTPPTHRHRLKVSALDPPGLCRGRGPWPEPAGRRAGQALEHRRERRGALVAEIQSNRRHRLSSRHPQQRHHGASPRSPLLEAHPRLTPERPGESVPGEAESPAPAIDGVMRTGPLQESLAARRQRRGLGEGAVLDRGRARAVGGPRRHRLRLSGLRLPAGDRPPGRPPSGYDAAITVKLRSQVRRAGRHCMAVTCRPSLYGAIDQKGVDVHFKARRDVAALFHEFRPFRGTRTGMLGRRRRGRTLHRQRRSGFPGRPAGCSRRG